VDVFVQRLITRTAECLVTFMEHTPLNKPARVGGRIILEAGSPVVWFTFPGRWYDIGLFHRRDGRFTGTYSNLLTPVHFRGPTTWETTDLYLDVWREPGGVVQLLDEAELDHAESASWLQPELAQRARRQAADLMAAARTGGWPPAIVYAWPLRRVRMALQPVP
jgi:predicted RNA-binding protein associated with RNAse of E/G family